MIEQTLAKELLPMAAVQEKNEEKLLDMPNVVGVALGTREKGEKESEGKRHQEEDQRRALTLGAFGLSTQATGQVDDWKGGQNGRSDNEESFRCSIDESYRAHCQKDDKSELWPIRLGIHTLQA